MLIKNQPWITKSWTVWSCNLFFFTCQREPHCSFCRSGFSPILLRWAPVWSIGSTVVRWGAVEFKVKVEQRQCLHQIHYSAERESSYTKYLFDWVSHLGELERLAAAREKTRVWRMVEQCRSCWVEDFKYLTGNVAKRWITFESHTEKRQNNGLWLMLWR